MALDIIESCKHFKYVVNLFLLLGSGPIQSDLLFKVQQPSSNDELLASDSLVEFLIIDVNQFELHFLLLFSILIVELHLCKQQLSIIVILDFKVASFGHVANDLSWTAATFGTLVNSKGCSFSGCLNPILRC